MSTRNDGPPIVISKPDFSDAIRHLRDHVSDSPLLPMLNPSFWSEEFGHFSIITSDPPPKGCDYEQEYGGKVGPVEDWLAQRAYEHVSRHQSGIVLLEDRISSPEDSFMKKNPGSPFWTFHERVFWHILAPIADEEEAASILSCEAGFGELAWFTKVPRNLVVGRHTHSLNHEDLAFMASNVIAVVTDIFRIEGYLEWHRA